MVCHFMMQTPYWRKLIPSFNWRFNGKTRDLVNPDMLLMKESESCRQQSEKFREMEQCNGWKMAQNFHLQEATAGEATAAFRHPRQRKIL